jgi:hypothetical protein
MSVKNITAESKIVVLKGAANPFTKGSGRAKRADAVLRAKVVENALSRGAKLSTVRRLVELKLIRVA